MRFEFIGGDLCLDFANTIHNSRAEDNDDELRDISDLLQWAMEARLLSPAAHNRLSAQYASNPQAASAALAAGIATRDLMLAIFSSIAGGGTVAPRRLAELNAALAHTPGFLRVHKHGDRIEMGWASGAEGLSQVHFAILTSAARLLASDRAGRIQECASADCTWLFADETRNHSRRWCDMTTCGNRMKARRHYHRSQRVTSRRKQRVRARWKIS